MPRHPTRLSHGDMDDLACCACDRDPSVAPATMPGVGLHPDACQRDGCVVHALCADCALKLAEDRARPEAAPAAPLNSIDALARLCRGEPTSAANAMADLVVMHAEADGVGSLGTAVMTALAKLHGKDRVEQAWLLVGGTMGPSGKRRNALTGRQLRALVHLMPQLVRDGEPHPGIKAVLDEHAAGSPSVGGM